MLRSICFKEWLKTGKVAILLLATGLLAIAGIYLTVRHDLLMKDAEMVWDLVVNQQHIYFSIFRFLPLISGLLIAVAQFVPETTEKRIKLALHLPLNEEEVILKMTGFGAAVVIALFAVLFIVFCAWGLVYFPYEIVRMAALTMMPWLLSGIAAYFLAAFIILEPIWKYRILYIVTGGIFISLFYKSPVAGAYGPALLPLAACTLLISTASLFSIYRFRKGEM